MPNRCDDHKQCVSEALSKAQMICADQNASFTPLRQKVFTLVWKHGHHAVKAYDLLEELQKEDPAAKPVTVYRALDFLLENGLVHKLESMNSFVGCNHPTRRHNCAFLICSACDEVSECCNNGDMLDAVSGQVDPELFRVESMTLEIHGVCQHCMH